MHAQSSRVTHAPPLLLVLLVPLLVNLLLQFLLFFPTPSTSWLASILGLMHLPILRSSGLGCPIGQLWRSNSLLLLLRHCLD